MKIIIRLFLLIFLLINNVSAYPDTRPTANSVARDMGSCSPMFAALGACMGSFYFSGLTKKTATICGVAWPAYFAARSIQEAVAHDFKDNSEVGNHQDLDNNGLNDFALKKNQNCNNLLGYAAIPKIVADSNNVVHKVFSDGSYQIGDGVRGGLPANMKFMSKTFTKELIFRLPGCSRDRSDNIQGNTYELFNPEKVCPKLDQIRVKYKGEKCLSAGECKNMSGQLVCAYEVDDMICAEAVFCSINLMGIKTSDRFVDYASNFIDFSNIDARVDNGVDFYNAGDKAEIIDCKYICDKEGNYRDPSPHKISAYNSGQWTLKNTDGKEIKKSIGEGGCFTDLTCQACYDVSVCVDQENAKLKPDCDPSDVEDNQAVCGYVYNPQYLAHCIPKTRTAYQGKYGFPPIISPHCTGDAKVKDNFGMSVGGFAGRAMRCIDQTLSNIFYGTYNIVGIYDGIDDQVTGLRCINSGNIVTKASDCENGLFMRFQTYAKNIITLILILSLVFIGFMVVFGLFEDLRIAAKYIIIYGVVLYFVNGDGWRDGYYDFLMEGGTELGSIVFNSLEFGIVNTEDSKFSGQQLTLPDDIKCMFDTNANYGPKDIVYPFNEKKYLVWDMYDCRMKNLFGEAGAGDAFTSFLRNSFFSVIAFVFLFILLGPIMMLLFVFVMLKTLFIAISAMIVVMLLVFISPLIIPLVLFTNKKARGIFDNWLKNLLGYSMVMIIILVMLALFFKVIDNSLYGDKIGDVYNYNIATQKMEISPECKDYYPPCFVENMKNKKYSATMNLLFIPVPWISMEGMMAFVKLAIRLIMVFAVMLGVFTLVAQSLIPALLQVNMMQDNIIGGMMKAVGMGMSAAGGVLRRAGGLAKKGLDRAKGKNDNKYQDGKDDKKDAIKDDKGEDKDIEKEGEGSEGKEEGVGEKGEEVGGEEGAGEKNNESKNE